MCNQFVRPSVGDDDAEIEVAVFFLLKINSRVQFTASWGVLGATSVWRGSPCGSRGVLGYVGGPLGVPWGPFGVPWGSFWCPLGVPWGPLGAPLGSLGVPGGSLGGPWKDLVEWFRADVFPRSSQGAPMWLRGGPRDRHEGQKEQNRCKVC